MGAGEFGSVATLSPECGPLFSPRLFVALCLVRVLRLMVAVVGDPRIQDWGHRRRGRHTVHLLSGVFGVDHVAPGTRALKEIVFFCRQRVESSWWA